MIYGQIKVVGAGTHSCWSGRAEKCEAQYVMLSATTKKQ